MIEVRNRIYSYSSDTEAFFKDFKDFFEGETTEETTNQIKIVLESIDIIVGTIPNSAALSINIIHKNSPTTTLTSVQNAAIGVYFIKTSKVKGVIFNQAYNDSFLPSNNHSEIFIGNSTNKVTQSQATSVIIGQFQSSTFITCISNSDNVSQKIVPIGTFQINNNLSGEITVIQKAWSKYSPYVMDNVYYLCGSNLASITKGECSLGDKNFYMFGPILLED